MKNEKGSIALALIIVFVIGISITVLTQVLVAEKITAKDIASSTLDSFYTEDEAIEFTKNLILQKINQKKWDEEITNQKIIEKVDLYQIESILNNDIPLQESNNVTVSLTNLQAADLRTYCEELYEFPLNPLDTPQFLGYNCKKQQTEFHFVLTINAQNRSKSFLLQLSNVRPFVDDNGNTIRLNSSEVIIETRSR